MRVATALLLLIATAFVQVLSKQDFGARGVFECVVDDAGAVEQTVQALRTLPGVKVTGWFAGVISVRADPAARQQSASALRTHCSRLIKSYPPSRPPRDEEQPVEKTVIVTPNFDTKEAARAMLLDGLLTSNQNINGEGISVGILSDSFNVNKTDFPAPCQAVQSATILMEGENFPAEDYYTLDEGRAMAELVCFIAPKAKIFFHTADAGYGAYAMGIIRLRDAGCKVIVDDYYYGQEPEYSPGILTQAIEEVAASGVTYVTMASNNAGRAWEGQLIPLPASDFQKPVPTPPDNQTVWHNWGSGPAPFAWLQVTLSGYLLLQWNEPFATDTNGAASAQSDLDLFVCKRVPTTQADYNQTNCLISEDNNLLTAPSGTGDPIEGLGIPTAGAWFVGVAVKSLPPAGSQPFPLRFKLYPGINRQFDIIPGQNGQTTGAGTVEPHGNTASALQVGAASFWQTPGYGQAPALLESFSSWGNQAIYYTAKGKALPAPKVLLKPDVVGPDRTATTFFNRLVNGTWRFSGTSASSPNVAAVAALLRQLYPQLTPAAVYERFRTTALDMFVPNPAGRDAAAAGPDRYTGFGFVDGAAVLTYCKEGACCKDNRLVAAGIMCRPAAHPCDVLEVCDGKSPYCPVDMKQPDGTTCSWYGLDHPFGKYMADASSPALKYKVASRAAAMTMASAKPMSSCQGTCSAGKCRMLREDAYCCFSHDDAEYYDSNNDEYSEAVTATVDAAAVPLRSKHSRSHHSRSFKKHAKDDYSSYSPSPKFGKEYHQRGVLSPDEDEYFEKDYTPKGAAPSPKRDEDYYKDYTPKGDDDHDYYKDGEKKMYGSSPEHDSYKEHPDKSYSEGQRKKYHCWSKYAA